MKNNGKLIMINEGLFANDKTGLVYTRAEVDRILDEMLKHPSKEEIEKNRKMNK